MTRSIPTATYRLQFNAAFTFDAATAIVDYLDVLGISHCYASNYLTAVPGSTHGYDITDPTALNPEIGDEASYTRWIATLRAHGMGHILDFVPNHMGIAKSANPWWQDVLENGPSAQSAPIFDIDWNPLKPQLERKVLLPVLGDSYGAVLERQEITLEYERGAFRARYGELTLPIAPGTYDLVLAPDTQALMDSIGDDSEGAIEFLSILTAIRHLPDGRVQDPLVIAERSREKEVIKHRLAALTEQASAVRLHVERVIQAMNGIARQPQTFDRLDALLDAQPYRLAYWRVAAEEINYRRFFDINELAAIRMEDPAVFERVHELVFSLIKRGALDGLRIDHVDGLFKPGDYLRRVQRRAREVRPARDTDEPFYLVVEKILGRDEELPDWPVAGTTGYDFLARLNGLFVDTRNESALNSVYERFTRLRQPYRELVYRSKQRVLRMSMASELNVLGHALNRFSERNRHYRDFTLNSLIYTIREIIACFPVYRTYVNECEEPSTDDRVYIEQAVYEARRRNAARPPQVFNFIRDLLLGKAHNIPEHERDEHMRFVGKFQQVTSPVTAKGIEDTAFYIYNRLVSLNEVGGEPDRFGVAPGELHAWFAARAARSPHGLSATATHDTKRGEDVRARLNVLSELPGAWKQATARWARANRRGRSMIDGQSSPGRNDEYLLYQTLVGTWPMEPMQGDEEQCYRDRIVAYMHKAMREAKLVTSWLNPSERHEWAMARFVDHTLSPDNTVFRDDFLDFQRRVARYGVYNSLSQLAVKIGAPGVPDFYQGTELWDFSLVDPDNRRPVDYDFRRMLLDEVTAWAREADRAEIAARLIGAWQDPRLKLYSTAAMLQFRNAQHQVFEDGRYEPLPADGAKKDHVFAFSRGSGARHAVIVVPRLVATLLPDPQALPVGERIWGDTTIPRPAAHSGGAYRNVLTGRCVAVSERDRTLPVAAIFEHFPVAILEPLS